MDKAEIAPATDDDFARFYGGAELRAQWAARAIRKGTLVAALGGLVEGENGVWYGFLDLPAHVRKPSIYRHILATFAEAKAKGAVLIKADCDLRIPRARELMERLGFEPTDETVNDKVIWNVRL